MDGFDKMLLVELQGQTGRECRCASAVVKSYLMVATYSAVSCSRAATHSMAIAFVGSPWTPRLERSTQSRSLDHPLTSPIVML